MWYRGVRYAKDFLVQYLNYIFLAHEKEYIVFTDGTKKLQFSRTPQVIKRQSWTYRDMPALLVGKASGNMNYVTFSKDRLKAADPDDTTPTRYVGGDFDLNLGVSVRARTTEERDNILDAACIYLSHPTAKDYFMRHYLVLPEPPRFTGESEIREPTIDYPIYASDFNIRIMSRWEDDEELTAQKLQEIIVNVTGYVELDSDAGRTILDGS